MRVGANWTDSPSVTLDLLAEQVSRLRILFCGGSHDTFRVQVDISRLAHNLHHHPRTDGRACVVTPGSLHRQLRTDRRACVLTPGSFQHHHRERHRSSTRNQPRETTTPTDFTEVTTALGRRVVQTEEKGLQCRESYQRHFFCVPGDRLHFAVIYVSLFKNNFVSVSTSP